MARGARIPLLIAACTAGAFVLVMALAYGVGLAGWADAAALQGFIGLRGPLADQIFGRLAHSADPLPYALIGIALIAVAAARGRYRHAVAAAVLLAGSAVSSQVLKPLLAFDRHHDFLGKAQISDSAFPSGHATASMALALAAVLVAPPALRKAVAIAGGVFTLGVSFSIIALGWHFPSDVAGGHLLAATWCLVAIAGLRAAGARRPEPARREPVTIRIDPRHVRAFLGSVGIATAATGLMLLPRAADYAERHTTFAAVATAILLGAAALLATVTATATRR